MKKPLPNPASTSPSSPTPTFLAILNLTPNSFSDTGQFLAPAAALNHALTLLNDGAKILDLGPEASSFFRPGVTPVPPETQWARLEPILQSLPKQPRIVSWPFVLTTPRAPLLSIDTRSSLVADRSLAAGAHIINDISAATHDPFMLETIAKHNALCILMHIGPSFPDNPAANDPDILTTVSTYLVDRIKAARAAGIPHEKIAIDPGIGFGKTPEDNWTLALRAHELQHNLHTPVVLGLSRKRFLTTLPPRQFQTEFQSLLQNAQALAQNPPAASSHERDPASAAATLMTLHRGVNLHRVHNVQLPTALLTMQSNQASPIEK